MEKRADRKGAALVVRDAACTADKPAMRNIAIYTAVTSHMAARHVPVVTHLISLVRTVQYRKGVLDIINESVKFCITLDMVAGDLSGRC